MDKGCGSRLEWQEFELNPDSSCADEVYPTLFPIQPAAVTSPTIKDCRMLAAWCLNGFNVPSCATGN